MAGPSAMNFNSHPELSDEEFVVCAANAYFGQAPTSSHVTSWTNELSSPGGSRYNLVFGGSKSWMGSGLHGNTNDPWFYNIPPWAALVIIPVAAITGFILAWKAWGHMLKEASKSNGSGYGTL